MTYIQVWYIIRIISSSPNHLHSFTTSTVSIRVNKHFKWLILRVNKGHLWPPLSVIGLINILCDLYSSVIHHLNHQLMSYWFTLRKKGLIRVTYYPLAVLGLINIIVTYTQVWYIIGIVSSSPTDFHSEKIGLIRVTYDPLSVLGLINI